MPIKKTSKHNVPWWSIEIGCARKRLNASRRRFQRCKNPTVRELYKNNYLEYRKDYNQMLINAKSESWKKFLLTIDAQNLPTGETTTSLDETINAVLQKSFPSDSEEKDNIFQKDYRHATRTAYPSFFDPSFSYDEVNTMVSMLKLNKSPGPDSISNEIIKQFHLAFPSFLHKLFNVCLNLGIFPQIWKLAQEALNFASDWSKSFKLDFNPDKTRFLAAEKRNVCYDAFQLYLDGTPLTMGKSLCFFSISNYDCILSPFFIPHPSERNAINIVQFSDKSTEDFPVICYTDGSKIDGRVGFAFVVFRSGVESEKFQFRFRDECTVFVAELLCLNFTVKWITEQNSDISEYLICTDSLSSLDSLKCISSSNNIIVEIQKQLKSLRDKNISIDFAFVRGHTGVLGNERADWLAKAATKRKIDIDVNIPKSFYKKIMKERMMKSWNQEYLISNKGSITKKFFPTINMRAFKRLNINWPPNFHQLLSTRSAFKNFCKFVVTVCNPS
ncbi:uncharacterized protein TNCV_2773691 [Trichonephila clavipes]|nr:uncharacterized protein TNCV_2773691 [Trichonephila clavipes]